MFHQNRMFAGANQFNQDIGGWNVGNVKDMSFMFDGANQFNQDISEWDVDMVSILSFIETVMSVNLYIYTS